MDGVNFFYFKNEPYLHVSQSSEGYYAKLCGAWGEIIGVSVRTDVFDKEEEQKMNI